MLYVDIPAPALYWDAYGKRILLRLIPRLIAAHCACPMGACPSSARLLFQARLELLQRHWFAEQVALKRMTTAHIQKLPLGFGPDPFGDDVQPQHFAHRDDSLDDRGIV